MATEIANEKKTEKMWPIDAEVNCRKCLTLELIGSKVISQVKFWANIPNAQEAFIIKSLISSRQWNFI